MPFCRYELGPFSSSFMLWPVTTGGTIKCHKKHLNEVFITWRHLHFSLKCPKIEQFHLPVSFLVLKSITWFYLEMSHFFYFRKPWNVPFSHLILKMGISKIPNWKWGISRKKHVTSFREKQVTENQIHRFRGISKKNVNAITCLITWPNSRSRPFWGISRYLTN